VFYLPKTWDRRPQPHFEVFETFASMFILLERPLLLLLAELQTSLTNCRATAMAAYCCRALIAGRQDTWFSSTLLRLFKATARLQNSWANGVSKLAELQPPHLTSAAVLLVGTNHLPCFAVNSWSGWGSNI